MDPLKQAELGTLPSDWQIHRFDSLFSVQQGKQVSKRNRIGENQRPFLRTKNVFWGRLDLADLDEMHFTEAEEDYVIVHELLHFYVPNHGKLWKSLMRAHLGDYERAESKLRAKAAMLSGQQP